MSTYYVPGTFLRKLTVIILTLTKFIFSKINYFEPKLVRLTKISFSFFLEWRLLLPP